MTDTFALLDELRQRRVRLVRKRYSRLMRALSWAFGLVGYDFANRAWTTIGRTIYYPDRIEEDLGWTVYGFGVPEGERIRVLRRYEVVLRHEVKHVRQHARLWYFHELFYLVLPVPVGLAYYRWAAEREAYAEAIRSGLRDPDETAETLWRVYGWPWPLPLMRRSLRKIADEDEAAGPPLVAVALVLAIAALVAAAPLLWSLAVLGW